VNTLIETLENMMVRKSTTYKTTDGEEFTDESEAIAHEEIITLKRAFDSARYNYGRALAQREKTIDGHPFEIRYHTYYSIRQFTGMPYLAEITFANDWEFTLDDHKDRIAILQPRKNEGGYTYSYVSDLYHDRDNARKALAAKQAEYLRREAKLLGIDLGIPAPEEGAAVLGGKS
jgi:hypothetical protein